jgi:uncharacterized protein YndB with AHSA1/START domain
MNEPDDRAVAVETRVNARPEVVFEFFVDPEKYRRWKGNDAQLDATPGGLYRVTMTAGVVRGEYVELDPPRRVVFTWGWEGDPSLPPGSTTVEIDLVPDGDDTIVRLRHHGFPDAETTATHAGGWKHYWPRLAIAAAGGDPGPDQPSL